MKEHLSARSEAEKQISILNQRDKADYLALEEEDKSEALLQDDKEEEKDFTPYAWVVLFIIICVRVMHGVSR